MHLKTSSEKCRTFCVGLNVLNEVASWILCRNLGCFNVTAVWHGSQNNNPHKHYQGYITILVNLCTYQFIDICHGYVVTFTFTFTLSPAIIWALSCIEELSNTSFHSCLQAVMFSALGCGLIHSCVSPGHWYILHSVFRQIVKAGKS